MEDEDGIEAANWLRPISQAAAPATAPPTNRRTSSRRVTFMNDSPFVQRAVRSILSNTSVRPDERGRSQPQETLALLGKTCQKYQPAVGSASGKVITVGPVQIRSRITVPNHRRETTRGALQRFASKVAPLGRLWVCNLFQGTSGSGSSTRWIAGCP